MEDLLTSIVFGTLKHLDARWLGGFLALARGPQGDLPLESLRWVTSVDLEFWPPMHERACEFCEPDVLVQAKDREGRTFRLLIEAKYRSGKSPVEGQGVVADGKVKDQLAKEWENLAARGAEHAAVVYLTAHVAMPREDIADAQRALTNNDRPSGNFVWLSWRDLPLVPGIDSGPAPLVDVLKLLERLELTPFRGIGEPAALTTRWTFESSRWRLSIPVARNHHWFFREPSHSWRWPTATLVWKFE